MNDYSDLLFLIGAMAIYALLVNNTSRAMFYNNQLLTTTEMEYGAVSVAQNVVEEARWMSYADATKANLEAINDNPDYEVEVTVKDTTISASDRPNKKIDIKVFSPFINSKKDTVKMGFIKTDRN